MTYWDTAESVCTVKQLRVLELRERHGLSLRQIALTCNISVSTVRSHLELARHNVSRRLKEAA